MTSALFCISSYLHSCDPPIIHGNLTCDTIFIQHNGLIKIGSGNACWGCPCLSDRLPKQKKASTPFQVPWHDRHVCTCACPHQMCQRLGAEFTGDWTLVRGRKDSYWGTVCLLASSLTFCLKGMTQEMMLKL